MRRPPRWWAALVGGLALVASAGACADEDDAPPRPTVAPAPGRDAPVEGRLDLVTPAPWSARRLLADFEAASGCRVAVTVAPSGDEAARRAVDAGGRVDVVWGSGLSADRLLRAGAVQPLDEDALTHLSDADARVRRPPDVLRDGLRYGVPFAWDADVLAFGTRRTTTAPTSWTALYDPARRGRIAVPDDPLQLGQAALVLPVEDPWALTPGQLAAAAALVRQQGPLVRLWWRDPGEAARLLRDEAIDAAQLPVGTVDALRREGAPVDAVLPREGTTGRVESWLLGARAPHPVCAYRWLDWIGSGPAQAVVADVGARSPVNAEACDALGVARCRALHVGDRAFLDAVRFRRAPEEPTDLREWRAAWTALRRSAG